MKKLTLIVAALGLCAVSAFSQGALTVANGTTLVTTNVAGVTGNARSSTTDFKVQLFYLPGSLPAPTPIDAAHGNLNGWEPMVGSPIISISPVAGKFSGGTETTGTDVQPSGQVWLEMVGWNGGFSSLQAALTAGAATLVVGQSAEWTQLSGSGAPGTPATISGAGQFPGMVLTPVPEPSIMILSGLGAAGLLLFRRKK